MYEKYIEQLLIEAKLRNLATSSAKYYADCMRHFFEYIQKDPGDITVYDVRDFLLMKSDTISATTINHYNSAIHFFFRRVLHKPWDDDIIPRMKEDYHLPVILSPDEINLLLDSVTDIKYKAIFSLLYGSGLRVSEVVALDYCDISRRNMTVHVRKSKSRIDRYTILSQKSLDILTEYWFTYNKPMEALFIQKNKPHVRIRHYGLLCTRTKTRHLALCRNLLGCKQYLSKLKSLETPQILETLYGIKITVCRCCGGHLDKPQQKVPLRI